MDISPFSRATSPSRPVSTGLYSVPDKTATTLASRRLSIAAMASASTSVGQLFNWGIVVGPRTEASLPRAMRKDFDSPSPRTSHTDGGLFVPAIYYTRYHD